LSLFPIETTQAAFCELSTPNRVAALFSVEKQNCNKENEA
jgi:hypothetical protein